MTKAPGKAPKKPKQKLRPDDAVAGLVTDKPKHDRLVQLARAVQAVQAGKLSSPRTVKLIAGGIPKMAQKLVEEAAETAIDAVRGERSGVINESADLLYNLVVLWGALGVEADEVWAEMDRREALLGMAEKLPKTDDGEQ